MGLTPTAQPKNPGPKMPVVVDCIGLGLVALCSLPSIHSALFWLRRQDARQPYYEDEDGISTPEAVTAYSARVPKAFALIFAFSGTSIAIALNVLRELRRSDDEFALEGWSRVACWVRTVEFGSVPGWQQTLTTQRPSVTFRHCALPHRENPLWPLAWVSTLSCLVFS